MTIIVNRFCYFCCKPSQVEVDRDKYFAWKTNKRLMVQDVFPELTRAQRETLISGAHEACFDEGMKEHA